MMNRMMLSLLAMFLLGTVAACSGGDKNKAEDEMPTEDTMMEEGEEDTTSESAPAGETAAIAPTLNIVETASSNGDFSTLVAAVQKADLVEALSGPGPFTVFAPT
ncbi:MAG: fasciclin domain-containing protein, partial [Myxococcota bacterium]